jgi:SAM-dependent methyltransferase
VANGKAEFVERQRCPGCGVKELVEVASGRFGDSPLRELIDNDPWGESPMPYIFESEWRFMGCAECSLRFHQRILSPEWNELRFARWTTPVAMEEFEAARKGPSDDFERARKDVEHVLRLEKQTRELRGDDPLRVLDFGCGNGAFLAMCELFEFVAVGVAHFAARRQGRPEITIYREIEDLKGAPEVGKGFHAVTLFETLEQVAGPLDTLNELSEYLLPGGILVLETTDCRGVTGIETEQDYRLIHPLANINAFDPRTLRGIARRAGFAPIERTVVQVNSEPHRVLKREIKRVVSPLLRPTTQLYFRKFR